VLKFFNELRPLGLFLTSLRTDLVISRGSIKCVKQRAMGMCPWYFYHDAGPVMLEEMTR
jgi:uncharacterized SAM-dependent methyltransferase